MKQLLVGLLTLLYTGVAVHKQSVWEAFKVPTSDFNCLVTTLYHEARNQPAEVVLAVAKVVLNRVDSPRYPKSICGVVKQQLVKGVWQFSFWREKKLLAKPIDKKSWVKMEKIAQQAINIHYAGFDIVDNAMYYHTRAVKPSWGRSPKLKRVAVIGDHIFYRRVKN